MKKSRVLRAFARRHVNFLKPFEARFAHAYRGVMRDLKAGVNFRAPQAADRREWRGRLVEAMAPIYHAAILAGGRDYFKHISIRKKAISTFTTKAGRKQVSQVIVSLEEQFQARLEETIDTTFDSLEEVLSEAVADGLDEAEIEDLIDEEFDDVLGRRTDAIATTEMNGAISSVRDYLSLQLAELQTWATAEDDRVRPTHVIYGDAGAKPVGFDWAQLIPDAGYTLRFPCDPECHEPGEIVNCRCLTIPAGEVELPPDEMRDYLEDFEMDPEDILLSEDQKPVYVTNRYTGKSFDPSQARDEFGRWTSDGGGQHFEGKVSEHEREVARAVAGALTPDLLKPRYRENAKTCLSGHCYAASEAAYHALGGKASGYKPVQITHEGEPHWFLRNAQGGIIDITAGQFETPVPYDKARGKGFLTGKPSGRAREILRRIGQKKGILKGDFEGHPFRGNQWTEGQGGGQGPEEGERQGPEIDVTGAEKPSMTDVGRALVGAPKGFNSNPAEFEPLVFGKTQVGDKREQAVKNGMAFFEKRFELKGGSKAPDLKLPATTPDEMKAKMEALFEQATPEELAHGDWYKKEAGATVDDLTERFKDQIPGLGKDQVAGIVAACSANNVWDDKYGKEGALAASNQKAAETILRTWAENKPVTITAHDLAMAKAYTGSLTEGEYKGLKLPEPGVYPFQSLANSDPRLAYLFNTSWEGAAPDKSGKLIKVEHEGGPMGFGGMPGHVLPSLGLLRGDRHEEVYGSESKVRSFYTNITRAMAGQEDDNATIDIWMARAMLDKPGEDGPIKGGHYKSFVGPTARYEGLRRLISENAKKHGMEPKQYQAVVWYVIRNQYERRAKERKLSKEIEKAHAAALRADGRETKRAAKRLAQRAQASLFKGFDPGAVSPSDDELLFAWLQRYIAHRNGIEVDDPIFGPWDELDEDAARSWEARVYYEHDEQKGTLLVFHRKGDFEGHPFRGNQWTSGYYTPQADEPAPPEDRALEEEKAKLEAEAGDLTSKRRALETERDTLQERFWTRQDELKQYLNARVAEEQSRLPEGMEVPFSRKQEIAEEIAKEFPDLGQTKDELDAKVRELDAARDAEFKADQKVGELANKLEEARAIRSNIDPTSLPEEHRVEVFKEAIHSMKAERPDDKTYSDLKTREDGIKTQVEANTKDNAEKLKALEEAYVKQGEVVDAAKAKKDELHRALVEATEKEALAKFYERFPKLARTPEEAQKLLDERREAAQSVTALEEKLRALPPPPRGADPYMRAESNLDAEAMKDPAIKAEVERYAKEHDNSVPSDYAIRLAALRDIKESVREQNEFGRGEENAAKYTLESSGVQTLLDKRYEDEQARLRETPEFAPKADEHAEERAALKAEIVAGTAKVQEWENEYADQNHLLEAQAAGDLIEQDRAIGRLPLGYLGHEENGASIDTYGVMAKLKVDVETNSEAVESIRVKVNEAQTEHRLATEKSADLRSEAQALRDEAKNEEQRLRDEFAVAAGPGYFARRCEEDDTYYKAQIDEISEAWQHIGGEGPSRIRVATGIGLGLEAGAIYDDDENRFLKPSDYDDLRNDERTIRWAGAMRREYEETQQDLLAREHENVVRLGQAHMAGSEDGPSDLSGDASSDPDNWSDDKKYDMDKAHQDFYESDAASEAEYEAMSQEFNNADTEDKLRNIGSEIKGPDDGDKAAYYRAQEYVGREFLKEAGFDLGADRMALPGPEIREEIANRLDGTDEGRTERMENMDPKSDRIQAEATKELRKEAVVEHQVGVGMDKIAETLRDYSRTESVLQAAGVYDHLSAEAKAALAEPKVREAIISAMDGFRDSGRPTGVWSPFGSYGGGTLALYFSNVNAPGVGEAGINYADRTRIAQALGGSVEKDYAEAEKTFPTDWTPDQGELEERADSLAAWYTRDNLREMADNEYNDDQLWDAVKDVDVSDVLLDQTPKYASGTVADYAMEKYRDDFQWDDSDSAFNDWFSSQDTSEYLTDEYHEAKASYEENENYEPPEGGEADLVRQNEPSKTEDTIKVYRGLKGSPSDYVDNFTESWSTSRKKAGSFGSTTILERRVPFEKILVFQGARNWRAESHGGMGNTEFEVMPLSDYPKWYREAYRRALAKIREQQAREKKG